MHNTKLYFYLVLITLIPHCLNSFNWNGKTNDSIESANYFVRVNPERCVSTEIHIVKQKHCSSNSLKALSICGWGKCNHFPGHIFERRSQQMCWKPKKYVWHCYAMTQHILFLFLQIYAVSIVIVKKAFR